LLGVESIAARAGVATILDAARRAQTVGLRFLVDETAPKSRMGRRT
jgi:hypothetical protein